MQLTQKAPLAKFVGLGCWLAATAFPVTAQSPKVNVPLTVPAGTPLRLYLTHRAPYKKGEPVTARFADSVWAFDRVVIPKGTAVGGQVSELTPVPRLQRALAIIRGDFTPLKQARLDFTQLTLPDGRTVPLSTESSTGLSSIYVPQRSNGRAKKTSGGTPEPNSKFGHLRLLAKQQAQAQVNARTSGFFGMVRAPSKLEWLEDFAWSKLPYHPQRYRRGTRFDSVLLQPLSFGSADFAPADLSDLGTAPAPDKVASIRLLSTISSLDAKVGDPLIGTLSAPLFSLNHHLALPEGTKVTGKVTLVRRARFFHRGGQLRFSFDEVHPPVVAGLEAKPVEPARTQLAEVEENSQRVKVDSEGTARATESKTRLIRPAIAALIAAKSMDNDEGRQMATGSASGANGTGLSLGGLSGFGLLGVAASQGPREIGIGLGFYGLAWSAYSTIVARGKEVTFEKNAPVAIRFAPPRTH